MSTRTKILAHSTFVKRAFKSREKAETQSSQFIKSVGIFSNLLLTFLRPIDSNS